VWNESQQGSEKNSFAGAVRTDHSESLALFQRERDILENRETIQRHGKVFDGEDGRVSHSGVALTFYAVS
jgi:hypothetical protein